MVMLDLSHNEKTWGKGVKNKEKNALCLARRLTMYNYCCIINK